MADNKSKIKLDKAKLLRILSYVLPPVLVIVFMLAVFKKNNIYPMGDKSVAWCDMSQQVVPLLNDFKDILDGKSSMFLNFRNSGGMNFYGVFFFFLASPFSFLVKFVPKEQMMEFANILVMLKMAVCAFTASCCFNYTHRKLDPALTVLLSMMYPFCGYTMMYYQNVIWLDMMYLFPLMIIALHRLTKKQKPLMYIIVLSASMVVNYYITYMVVIFIMLFTAVYVLKKRKEPYCSRVCRELVIGSFISALLTAVVWLPSLLQYMSSGRGGDGTMDSLINASMLAGYHTVWPMLFCTAFAFVVILSDIASHGIKNSELHTRALVLLGLTLIPFLLEPVNKMWHTGQYMSFPCRFGYMTIFLALYCCAFVLEKEYEYKNSIVGYIICGIASGVSIYCSFKYAERIRQENYDGISRYSTTLWGDENSFRLLMGIFLVIVIAYSIIWYAYKHGYFFRSIFIALTAIVFGIETYSNLGVYMLYPAEHNEKMNKGIDLAYDLGGRVDDEDFYRMKSFTKVYNNNLIGAMGYDSICHYTSLNDQNYMFTMKRLGYTGVWMETGSTCGTRLTDALLSIKYEINGGYSGSEEIYNSEAGFIHRLPDSLPMGLLLEKGALDGKEEIPADLERAEVQQFISEAVFDEDVVTRFEPRQPYTMNGDRYVLKTGKSYTYTIDIDKPQTIYVDCFDKLTNHLSEPVYDSISISVNDKEVMSSFPNSGTNGVIRIGDFKPGKAKVTLKVIKDVECASFGVFGIDSGRLGELCGKAEGVGLKVDGSGLSGSCTTDSAKTCFVSVPYQDNFTVKVNGNKVSYDRALSGFISFDVPRGDNDIRISYVPKGFWAGLVMTVIGAGMLALYLRSREKLNKSLGCDTAAKNLMLFGSIAVIFAIYILPMLINILAKH